MKTLTSGFPVFHITILKAYSNKNIIALDLKNLKPAILQKHSLINFAPPWHL